ncbi:MAG: hypothetical protein QG622_192 [Actinomycetota bacterium]|nr:hypothetical protein [Actinomycetota bacterium]
MTSPDRRIVDLTTFDRPDAHRSPSEQGDVHLLRLVLDLQLDALLLTLGAAAHAESRRDSSGSVPWRRWLVEDLELARALAGVLVDGEVSPLPALGGGLAPNAVATALDNLAVRYESMENLLTSVLDRRTGGQPWRGAASEALARCRKRLAELQHCRRTVIAADAVARTPFLPGEWLG